MQTKIEKSSYTKDDALQTLDRNIAWINSADSKSSIMMAVIGFLYSGSLLMVDQSKLTNIIQNGLWYERLSAFFLSLSALVMLLSLMATLVFLILVLLSRTKSVVDKPSKNFFYFKDISNKSYIDFKELVKEGVKSSEILDDLISQVYITSVISSIKYNYLRKSYESLIVTLISTLIYSILLATI